MPDSKPDNMAFLALSAIKQIYPLVIAPQLPLIRCRPLANTASNSLYALYDDCREGVTHKLFARACLPACKLGLSETLIQDAGRSM